MPIRVVCPSCATQLSIKDEYAGRSGKCPKCGARVETSSQDLPAPLSLPKPIPEEIEEVPKAATTANPLPPRATPSETKRERNEHIVGAVRSRRHRHDNEGDHVRPSKSSSGLVVGLAVAGAILFICCGGVGVLFLSGLQKVKEDRIAENKGEDPDTPNPATVNDPALRVKSGDLLGNYRRDPEFAADKWGGKKYLIEFTFSDALEDADGRPVIADDADKGFRRPTVVARLANRKGFKAGRPHTFHVEGTVKGPVQVKDAKWFSKWADLPVPFGALSGQVLVIEDGRIVPEPKP